MTQNKSWMIPAAFFALAAQANWSGRLWEMEDLARMAKPALMPLLAVTTVAAAGGIGSRGMRLLVCAQLFGWLGDVLLMRSGFGFFVGGMAAFLMGHLFYITLFGGKSWKGFGMKVWLPALAVMAAIVCGLVVAIGIKGALLGPMLVYGMILMLLIFSGLAGVIRFGGPWWWILSGALLFTFSDALIATGSFDALPFAGKDFVIMLTYVVAQAFLAAGALRLERPAA